MTPWLPAALAYVSDWLEFQRRHHDQPGCAIAIAEGPEIVLEAAFGTADLATGERLTPRHGFRIASHSKTFTSAGILRLVEAGALRLDDTVGSFVPGLHPDAAAVTIAQVLSHSAGLVRDGTDAGYFIDRRPNPDRAQIVAELAKPPILPASQRFKYSNYGYGLLGLVIEAATGRSYADWIADEVVAKVGLAETKPDITLWSGPMASGHSPKLPLDRRVVLPGDNPCDAMISAAGFVATAADTARFFAQLSPKAQNSILSPLSRREMTRRLWADEDSALGRHYGLGTISGGEGDWSWFGHSGGFQGFLTRTAVLPKQDLTVSVLTNAIDGLAHPWLDGVLHILKRFSQDGAPSTATRDWSGRWWTIWRANDLVPFADKVTIANPAQFDPFFESSEIAIEGPDQGRIVRASGFSSPGEPARLARGAGGTIESVWLGGANLVTEEALRSEMTARY
ncbi:serine hydrolase domain-containing protein [Bosea sp. PAMC 26642]|uniref:serine hydrolase domain-containing protein n=1 Tax=Bosea sp. (strain PAMC 26642) TaxID=1792307 RepID=UPI000770484E|nr:serine hydrolase domain-containing protein [Bosea sp. PAMC 26642]AMJ60435.1 serine hydrolase [Bosea sp. PAMC 26642]